MGTLSAQCPSQWIRRRLPVPTPLSEKIVDLCDRQEPPEIEFGNRHRIYCHLNEAPLAHLRSI